MEPYVVDNTPLWDLSQASSYTHLADDDFLALLQNQFPQVKNDANAFVNGVNPQNISTYPLPSLSPPSEDSSPSPMSAVPNSAGPDEPAESALKRKASDDDLEEDAKGQTTKKVATGNTRRKSTGTTGHKDETRLLKRKEQNRAAQRAFRERKEKHVKDLEDKVAELEAKNEATEHENENLRDLLARLQNENLALKQTSFTFSAPINGASSSNSPPVAPSYASSPPFTASSGSTVTSPTMATPDLSKVSNPLEWSSLTSFDPAMLNLLDENPQLTATDGARHMDFGFGPTSGLTEGAPWTTIASNPMFMSFASNFDSPPNSNSPPASNNNGIQFNNAADNHLFDLNNISWSPPPQNVQPSSLEDLISGFTTNPADFNIPGPSDSPVAHHVNSNSILQHSMFNGPAQSQSPAVSNSSSPSSTTSDPLFDTPKDSSASDSDHESHPPGHSAEQCPKTKAEFAERIHSSGLSPFAPISNMAALNPMVKCSESTTFPKTQQNDSNVEVLTAWRNITSNPQFKDVDINDLCTQFTSKARCDGKKVVLEPQSVDSILRNLSSKQ